MTHPFFEKPILNSPYGYPARHWELDPSGQSTQQIIERRRRAEFITPIPKAKKQKGGGKQDALLFGDELFTQQQAYDHTAVINSVRHDWATLNSDTSRAVDKPRSGRIAVKVINHLRDEVMKVFRVS